MACSEVKAKPGSDVTSVGEDTLDFNDDTLKGAYPSYSFIRSRWTGKLFNVNVCTYKRSEFSPWIQQTPP